MRIFDEFGNLLDSYYETKGRLVNDRILVCQHKAVEEVKESGHYEVEREYPNGGKDLRWVVDVQAVKAQESWDEYEDILRFIPYSAKELAELRISELKAHLSDTDYNILKIVEGAATLAEMASVITRRALWRKEINELEEKIAKEGVE